MNNGSSSKSQTKPKKVKTSKELKEDSVVETMEPKQVPENENPKTDGKEEKGSDGTSDKEDKKEKVPEDENPKTEAKEDKGSDGTSDKKDKKEKSIRCCKRCKAKAKMMKEKLKDEEEKQKQKTENGDPKTEEKGSKDAKDEKEKSIITWRHKSTKKKKDHGRNSFNVNPPYQTPRSMYHGGPSFSNPWNMYAPPRVMYPAFAKGPMYGQCSGGGGGPFQPYQPMNPAAMYRGALMSPYPPMAAAAMYPPYWQSRPDANPITRYTTYRDNYSYFYI